MTSNRQTITQYDHKSGGMVETALALTANDQQITAIVSVVYFSAYALAIDVNFLHMLPLTGVFRLVLTTLFAWLTLRLNVVWLCAAIFAHIGLESSLHNPLNNWQHSMFFTLLSCGLLSWRTRFHAVRDRIVELIKATRSQDVGQTSRWFEEAVGLMTWIGSGLLVMFIATAMLTNNPLTGGREKWISWSIQNKEVLWPGPTLLVVVVAVAIGLREWSWRNQSRVQAVMSLRNERIKIQFPDLMRTVRYRIRNRIKKSTQSTKGAK